MTCVICWVIVRKRYFGFSLNLYWRICIFNTWRICKSNVSKMLWSSWTAEKRRVVVRHWSSERTVAQLCKYSVSITHKVICSRFGDHTLPACTTAAVELYRRRFGQRPGQASGTVCGRRADGITSGYTTNTVYITLAPHADKDWPPCCTTFSVLNWCGHFTHSFAMIYPTNKRSLSDT